MPSSDSSGSTAIAGSTGDSLSLPSASSDAAVAASRRSAELSSCSARRDQQLGRRLLQEAGGELMQQAADVFGGVDEQARLFVGAVADHLRARERVLERAREVRQIGEADRRRAAGERMGERDRHFADRPMQLHRPLGDLGHQAARQLVGLVEIDVEERDADAQRADHLDVLVARRLAAAARRRRRPRGRRARGADVGRRGRRRSASPVERSSSRPATPWPARAAPSLGARLLDQAERSAGLPRSRSTMPDGAKSNCSLVSVVCIASRRARRRSDRTSPRHRPAAARPPPARSAGAPGSARRSKFDRSSSNDRSSASGSGSGSPRRRRGRGRRGSRSRSARLGRSAGRPSGSAMSEPARPIGRRRRGGSAAALTSRSLRVPRAVRGDVLDPLAEVAEHPVGELDQRRLGGALLGELGVEDLLARPRRLAERTSARPSASCPSACGRRAAASSAGSRSPGASLQLGAGRACPPRRPRALPRGRPRASRRRARSPRSA